MQADELDDIGSSISDPNIFKGNAVQTLVKMQALESKLDTAIQAKKRCYCEIDNLEKNYLSLKIFIARGQKQQEIQSHFITAKELLNNRL